MKQLTQHIIATFLFTVIYFFGITISIGSYNIELDTRLLLFAFWVLILLILNLLVHITNDLKDK